MRRATIRHEGSYEIDQNCLCRDVEFPKRGAPLVSEHSREHGMATPNRTTKTNTNNRSAATGRFSEWLVEAEHKPAPRVLGQFC